MELQVLEKTAGLLGPLFAASVCCSSRNTTTGYRFRLAMAGGWSGAWEPHAEPSELCNHTCNLFASLLRVQEAPPPNQACI